jgi:hypothetical protein
MQNRPSLFSTDLTRKIPYAAHRGRALCYLAAAASGLTETRELKRECVKSQGESTLEEQVKLEPLVITCQEGDG